MERKKICIIEEAKKKTNFLQEFAAPINLGCPKTEETLRFLFDGKRNWFKILSNERVIFLWWSMRTVVEMVSYASLILSVALHLFRCWELGQQ